MTLLTLAMLPSSSGDARGARRSGVQSLARDARGLGVGEAIHDVAVLDQGLAAAAQLLERHPLLDPRVGELVARRVVAEEGVPGLDGFGELLLAVEALADPVLGVVGEV